MVLAALVPVSMSLLSLGVGGERLVQLGGTDVGQAAGGLRPGVAELVGGGAANGSAAASAGLVTSLRKQDNAVGVERSRRPWPG